MNESSTTLSPALAEFGYFLRYRCSDGPWLQSLLDAQAGFGWVEA